MPRAVLSDEFRRTVHERANLHPHRSSGRSDRFRARYAVRRPCRICEHTQPDICEAHRHLADCTTLAGIAKTRCKRHERTYEKCRVAGHTLNATASSSAVNVISEQLKTPSGPPLAKHYSLFTIHRFLTASASRSILPSSDSHYLQGRPLMMPYRKIRMPCLGRNTTFAATRKFSCIHFHTGEGDETNPFIDGG